MNTILQPILELTVIIPGMLLTYLPVRSYIHTGSHKSFSDAGTDHADPAFLNLLLWLVPLLAIVSILGGAICYHWNLSTAWILFPLLPCLFLLYHKTLRISIWKSVSVFLAVCAVFACVNSLSRAISALLMMPEKPAAGSLLGFLWQHPDTTGIPLWFCTNAGFFYNLICWVFVLAAWYPASHAVRTMMEDDNFAQTWYVFWMIPLLFTGLNLFMVPRYKGTLYTGRILQGYIIISLVLLVILALFYTMFLLMAISLNRNARLQQENHFLSLQKQRYDTLLAAIEEARHARHDLRHHFVQLSSLAEQGDLEKIRQYLKNATNKIPDLDMHFCENRAADSVIGYYCALAKRENIPFHAQTDLPAKNTADEIDMCLVLSNLLENALEASLKTSASKRSIKISAYLHSPHLLLIQVTNPFDGEIHEKNHVFQSSKRHGNGVGIQSVRRIAEKNGGASTFTYEDGIFSAKIMLRI